ncbi:MAG: peptidylprolyl isomerase [Bdellovibrionales bacterium]|nr:peptidylprolyl isomerase [Bdellovibrionales bacterium]
MMKVGLAVSLSVFIGGVAGAAVIATVNQKQLTDQDLKVALGQFSEGQRNNILKDPTNRRQILLSMIDQELLNQEADRQKLGEEESIKLAVESFRRQQMVARLLEKNLSSRVTQAAAKKFYDQNKLLFNSDQVRAQHILVSTDTEAREILTKLKDPKADFQKLAEKQSRDPSAKNNRGELGFFTRDQLDPEFTKAAFAANAGEVVGPVKTVYGYHVIKVLEKKAGKTLPFEEAEMKATGMLRQKLGQEYLAKLREQSKIQIEDKALEKL